MGKENKSYRIRTNVGQDSVVNFSVDNTTEQLEILSLKINQENTYRLMGSNTGIVAGRVLANGGFGVPNVKVSVFIEYEDTDNIEQRVLYTYTGTTDRNTDGVRYNLLPDNVDDECHQNIGTFPSKRVLLDNNNWIDIFDKYYKFTTRTNEAGDYMIYGVPTGNQTIHMDVDMSDIGVLSQKPRDMIYNGYNGNMFESPTKFKVDTNIDALAQVRTQDQTVYVYPFWGDTTDSNLNASITRCDMNINYKFEPTCIFMGSVITDTGENAMTKKCIGAKNQGKMADMITGEGKIEMIRKTPNGQVEQFSVNGDNNINGDGVWCYQIPMNLDYVMHDEFGKMVMTDNPNIGIPTRARVRFRLSMAESPSDAIARKRARFLIPNNPRLVEEDYPDYCETKEIDYEFGTKTRNENFRDLFWNNVYTVKSYIPRLQKTRLPNSLRHLGIKTVNHPGGHNPMPFNNLRIKFNFVYMFLCTLVKVLVTFVRGINTVLTFISWIMLKIGNFFFDIAKGMNNVRISNWYPLNRVAKIFAEYNGGGVKDKDKISANNYLVKVWEDVQYDRNERSVCKGIAAWFMRIFLGIGCGIELNGLCETDDGEPINVSPGTNDNVKNKLKELGIMACNDRVDILYNCIENQLAQDNEVTQFNFYNDWVNGVVYLPLWYRKIKKRRNGTIKKDVWCSTDNSINNIREYKKNLRLYNTNIPKRTVSAGGDKSMGKINPLVNNEDTVKEAYADDETGTETLKFTKVNDENCYGYQCHKFSRTYFKVYKGLVYEKTTMLGDRVYYYKPCDYDPSTGNSDLVTLFATDLVLLGSLNNCDIHGIPQFFKTLESTTYNMPPDLLSEYYDYTNENNQTGNDEQDNEEIDLGSRITEYTGADWGNLGVDQSNYNEATITVLGSTYTVNANENQYDNGGLFYGLTCFNSYTKPKSCINLSRICELGISLDETDEIPAKEGSGTDSGVDILTPDGFISYDEIYNPDYRSMFATLNGNFLKTTLNPETGLLEYDFNYLYIDNFDGSLKQLMKAKTVNGYTENSDFEEKANYINNHNLEQSSDAYLSFRYGNYVKRNGNKIYYYENNNTVGHAGFATILGPVINGKNRQPRYENSFYFYFGLNEGKTAIDKFNTEFFSDCTNKFASDVPYDLTYQGNSWCPINSRDGFIAFNMNVEAPYTVTFTNKDTNAVYFQDNITSEKFIFCDPQYMPDGYSKYTLYTLDKKSPDDIESGDEVYIMPNGRYTIELTDAYDNTYEDSVTFELPRIGFICDVNPFNCKNAELMERFKDEGESLSTTYADIANHARFVGNNMVVDMDALTYSLFDPDYIIKNGEVYYTKNTLGVFRPSVASQDITVPNPNETYYYYHEPKLDRDIRGFVALSEMTEDDFRIDFEPINEDFFGSNYIGTSVSVHVSYEPYAGGATIPFGETYFLLSNGKYEPMVAQDDITVPDDNKIYTKPIVSVTENHSESGVDICGYLGHIIYNGVITYYFGVPYGGQKYRIKVTQLCEREGGTIWEDSDNVTVINVIVYEDEFKLFINGIDYDLIQKFKTGWNDANLVNGEFKDEDGNYSKFVIPSTGSAVYGWDDILNIGSYTYQTSKNLSQISYMRNETELGEVMAICEVLHSNYSGNATGEDNGETPYAWNGVYCYDAPSDDQNYYYKGTVDKITYSYSITNDLYNSDGNKVIVLIANGPYYKSDSTPAVQNIDYTITDVYTYTIKPGISIYDSNGNKLTADQIQHGVTYYLDSPQTVVATLGVDYFDNSDGTFSIAEGVILYDNNGNVITVDDIVSGGTYYLDSPQEVGAVLGVDYFETHTYAYQIINDLYDNYGNLIHVIVHGNTYYVDENHTVEAETGVDYTEVATDEQINVTRYDNKIEYLDYSDNEYLYDGNTYRYEYPFGGGYREGAVNGYPNGIRVNMFRRTLRIADNVTLYKNDGGTYVAVSSMELTHRVTYYKQNGSSYAIADEGSDYVLASPVISYELETPLYTAEFRDTNSEVLVSEDNYGVLTYKVEDNIEYSNLECLSFYDYRNIIDTINTTIYERGEMARKVGGTFRINESETTLTLTTKTKAKPVRYLIAGNSEISVVEKMYNYKPRIKTIGQFIVPVRFGALSDIDNTKFVATTSIKNVSDGYVVDKNLETPSVTFSLPTLTNDYGFIQYNDDETINDGDTYYSEETIACKEGDVIKPYTGYYFYNTSTSGSEYYQHMTNGSTEITVSTADVGKYFYITGEKVKNTAVIVPEGGFTPRPLVPKPINTSSSSSKTVTDFVKYAHTTSKIYKIDNSGDKKYLPYYINKYKHPYYVSVMNDNDSVIPPGKDLTNFTDFGENKNLDTTFGVHFYNKPLKSDFKMMLSFINNIPAYPKYTLGGDSYVGTAYSLSSDKYYKYTYPEYSKYKTGDVISLSDSCYEKNGDTYTPVSGLSLPYTVQSTDNYYYNTDKTVIEEGTLIYATVDNQEPSGIVLNDNYYLHTVKYNPQNSSATVDSNYVKYNVGDVIKFGQKYYTRGEILGEVIFVEKTVGYTPLQPPQGSQFYILPDGSTYYIREGSVYTETKGEMYNPGDIIPKDKWYVIYDENSGYTPKYSNARIVVPNPNNMYYKADVVTENNTKYYKKEDITVSLSDNNYYHRNETIREIKENILIDNGLVRLADASRDSNWVKYQPGTRLLSGDWYYVSNNGVITKNVVTRGVIIVQSDDNFYHIVTSGVKLYGYDFVNTADDLNHYVYNGDIIYYTEKHEEYPNNTIINIGEKYYLRNGSTYMLITNSSTLVVNTDDMYYKYSPQKYYRHEVNIDVNKMKLSDYIPSLGDNIGGVYYPNKTSVSTSILSVDGSNIIVSEAKYILVNRKCSEYNGSSWSTLTLGEYGYPISTDPLKNDESTQRSWRVKRVDNINNNSATTVYKYNNYGAYRYYDFGKENYALELTKRETECAIEPVYKVVGDGEYTPSELSSRGIDSYELINSDTVIPWGDSYYYRSTPSTPATQFVKKYVTSINGLTVPPDNTQYYYGVEIGNYTPENEYRGLSSVSTGLMASSPFYGEVVSVEEVTGNWQPVNVFMPGFLTGYFYNGIPRSDDDKSNIKAELNETEIGLYTPNTSDNPDTYDNINVRRLVYTPNNVYNSNYPATYGEYTGLESNSGLRYQYVEVPLADTEITYTDTYGDEYSKMILGTLSVVHDNPVFTYYNLGRARHFVDEHLDYEDHIVNKTFYTNDEGYVMHQTLYYVYDLEKTEYPLYYYDTNTGSGFNSKLKYDKEQDRFYFTEMPEILVDINNSNYISKSKSTDFNVWEYLRDKYGQGNDVWVPDTPVTGHWEPTNLTLDLTRPRDKFFTIACVDGYYAISPVIETQMFLVVMNYNGFDNRNGSPVYITARDSRVRTSAYTIRRNVHYIEDLYYMLYYRFVVHAAIFDYDNADSIYNSDVYTQVCSVPEGTAEHCYIKVVDNDDGYTYWASAIKINLSSIGVDNMDDSGKIIDWLKLVIEDASGCMRSTYRQGGNVDIVEFGNYGEMMENYRDNN